MSTTPRLDEELAQRLREIREKGLYRELRRIDSPQSPRLEIGGQPYLNFSSNDYLGLANDPCLKEAAVKAIAKYGVGTGASRLVCGSLAPHHELEAALAAFKGTEAALSFSSGFTTALGSVCALLDKNDVVVLDKLAHACLVDAARLSGAKLRVFDHNDLNDLETILKWADQRNRKLSAPRGARTLIVTESVFSMDGDHAPLRELVELKDRYGAWLMVDEAHATGLHGAHRSGGAEECGVSDRVEIQMGTLGKALGAAGGYICGSRALIDYLVNRARSFIFSTAPAPAIAAAATAAVHIVQSREGGTRCQQVWQRVEQLDKGMMLVSCLAALHRNGPRRSDPDLKGNLVYASESPPRSSAIIPIRIGGEAEAVAMADALRGAGIYIPAIRYPTVPRGQARLRVTVTASHRAEDISKLLAALADLGLLTPNLKPEVLNSDEDAGLA